MQNKLKKSLYSSLLATLIIGTQAYAHGRFILPTHTVLSGKETQKISLISSISNDIFHPDMPLADDGKANIDKRLQGMFKQLKTIATNPDGQIEPMSWQAHARLSVSDYSLAKDGTYRLSIVQSPTHMTTFKNADGSPNRVFGKNSELPENITHIKRRLIASRVDTFISRNTPNKKALSPVGAGLELGGESHPNDLFINEPVSFKLLMNGKSPEKSINVKLVQSGTRHRNKRDEIDITTAKTGEFDVTFKKAGFYLLEAEVETEAMENSDIDFYHYSLYITLEVFP